MPSLNTLSTPKKTETEQIEYRKKCDDFITENYDKLLSYALHFTRKDEDAAADILHHVCLRLLEGKIEIDFKHGSLALVQMMMRTRLDRMKKHKQVVSKYGERLMYEESLEKATHNGIDRLDHSYIGLRHDIPKLLEGLTVRERQFIIWEMEGFTLAEMAKLMENPCTKARIHQVIAGAREKMKRKALILLRDAEVDDLGE